MINRIVSLIPYELTTHVRSCVYEETAKSNFVRKNVKRLSSLLKIYLRLNVLTERNFRRKKKFNF